MEHNIKLNIKNWAAEDRPREKLMKKGINSLSDAELVAILIGSGTREETAVDVAKRLLNSVKNNLNELGKLSLKELIKTKGIGEAKAISIIAALELGKRRKLTDVKEKPKITSSADAYNLIQPVLGDEKVEEFWVIYLNRSNRVIEKIKISQGGVTGTVTDVKIILKHGVELLASSIILCHNHPSGNIQPSNADVLITEKIKEAANFLDIQVLDHLIISANSYFSFADEGKLQ